MADFENSGKFESCLAGKNIFGLFPISGGFLADLTNSAKVVFLSGGSGGTLAV
jgi:hypothetical protein